MPRHPQGLPLISANFAITWDGRISTRRQTPSDFSSPEDKRRFLEIRSQADAVIATVKTAASDGMTMGLPKAQLRAGRIARGQSTFPLRVLVTHSGRIPLDLPLWGKPGGPVLLFAGQAPPRRTRAQLEAMATLQILPDAAGKLDLPAAIRLLYSQHGVRRLHCEGGGELLQSLLAAELLHELHLTLCPRIFGGETAPTLTGTPGPFLPASTSLRLLAMEQVGGECFLKYRVKKPVS